MDEKLMQIFQKSTSQDEKILEIREYLKTLPRQNLPRGFQRYLSPSRELKLNIKSVQSKKGTLVQPITVPPVSPIPRRVVDIIPIAPMIPQSQKTTRKKQIIRLVQATQARQAAMCRQRVRTTTLTTGRLSNKSCHRTTRRPPIIMLWRRNGAWKEIDDE